ncbi:MAG: XTP/dITP diphosphatase [Candidatus Bathyarchaeota archaeon]|nr:XTP/dITP diphosphatase [Candidatus Bathyarchaeota archaeon]MDH5689636.1 XTP/dITP diphosphatase [Candidatus Bathyarchaeota archaeon]
MVKEKFPLGRIVFFVTENVHKFKEARALLAKYEIAAAMLRIKSAEIQDDKLENIARTSALEAFGKSGLPLIVEDAGLFISALNGFPGPYSSYVYKTIGNKGILRLMEGIANRRAQFRSAIAYCSPDGSLELFLGITEGNIAEETRGSQGFGFDPIFEPSGSDGRAFAELDTDEKNMFSHRSRALTKFAEHYRSW